MTTLLPAAASRGRRARLILAVSLLLGLPLVGQGQSVGIGTTAPDASAVLELAAAGKGLLIPRLDSAARVAITAPATGLLVFQTAPRPGFYYYGGAAGWLFLADKARGGDNLGNGVATRAITCRATPWWAPGPSCRPGWWAWACAPTGA
ncbi:hypothetical protein [Hymenobacter jeollabukensis]|uniref:Uncharacterized protein n=1 Tax=Hymenobacter jeollabukensis TaxID=2025313 RepID=A0A5R8WP45_9BACT|nr:hypothetical protein [Hymenobacter jeollabukensis]TLM91825.1 hypothetical protein FDY95_14805 [Hymenobacter jeollabukensis]